MNERIRELAKTAREQMVALTAVDDEQWRRHEEFVEKFAELIVEKCAGIIESQDVDPSFKLRMSWAVKQYFGVDE